MIKTETVLRFAVICFFVVAGVAVAHEGVKNPAVMVRMDLMSGIGKATEVLVRMSKGEVPFDAALAAAARADMLRMISAVPDQFQAPETDPKSKALPLIWQDWGSFQVANDEAYKAVAELDPNALDALRAGTGPIAKSCSACHERFRQP